MGVNYMMNQRIQNVYVSGYNSGQAYEKYDIVKKLSGEFAYYYVAIKDVPAQISGFSQGNDWRRFDTSGFNFTEVWTPTYQTSLNFTPNSINFVFGDGYSQRSDAGLWASKLAYNVSFDNIDNKELKSLAAFFEYKGGSDSFVATLNPIFEDRKFTAMNWNHEYSSDNINSLTVNFYEVVN